MEKNNAKDFLEEIETPLLPRNIEKSPVSASLSNLLSVIEQKLTPKQLSAVQEIGLAIGKVGLTLDDACLRSRVTKEELDNWMLYCPEVKTYLRIKQVEYKYKLLDVVTKQATDNADVKIAMWLLEKNFAEEYDSSLKKDIAKMNRESSEDVVEMAFAFVRRSNSAAMPVKEISGKGEDREAVKIHDMKDTIV